MRKNICILYFDSILAAHEFKSAGAQGSSCSVQPSSLYSVSDSNSSSPVSPSNVSLDIKICSEPSTPDFVPFQQKLLVCDSFKAPRQQAEFSYTEHHISTLVSDENMDEKLYNELLEKKKMAEYRKMLVRVPSQTADIILLFYKFCRHNCFNSVVLCGSFN